MDRYKPRVHFAMGLESEAGVRIDLQTGVRPYGWPEDTGPSLAEAREVLEPWQGSSLMPALVETKVHQQRLACGRVRGLLREMRINLERTGASDGGEVPSEFGLLQREVAGRLHEVLWLVRQAARRSAQVATMLDDAFERSSEIEGATFAASRISRRAVTIAKNTARAA